MKIVFLLIVYFAGFATAIYFVAPVADAKTENGQKSFASSAFKSDDFAKSFNTKMHEFVAYSKDAAKRGYNAAKQKLDERKVKS